MVMDKLHARARGGRTAITRQPSEGDVYSIIIILIWIFFLEIYLNYTMPLVEDKTSAGP